MSDNEKTVWKVQGDGIDGEMWAPWDGDGNDDVEQYLFDVIGERFSSAEPGDRFSWSVTLEQVTDAEFTKVLKQQGDE